MQVEHTHTRCFLSVLSCLFLACLYVGSLYVWRRSLPRDHPSVIKRRCASVLLVSALSPAVVKTWIQWADVKVSVSVWELMGVHTDGLVPAAVLPLLLTMVFYLGPLIHSAMDNPNGFTGEMQSALDVQSWRLCVGDAVWLRNQVVAPVTEELVFRGAMLPMLVPCTGPTGAILTAPLFFGVGDQNVKFTNWFQEYSPATCGGYRCVSMIVHTSESGRESKDNFQWLEGSCSVPLGGYVCQYNYKGMCPPLEDEGRGPPVYTTPFQLLTSLLTHVPFGSTATVQCPANSANPDPTEKTVLCIQRDDETVGWSSDSPFCPSSAQNQDWCSRDHGCEQYCQSTDTDYYCYCSDGFTVDEDGYSCKPDLLSQTNPPELSDSAGPTDSPQIKPICVEMGCEYNCMETPRGPRCTCPPGYQMGPDGRRCSDVDECQQEPCPQLCVNIPGTFHCTCLSGYQPDDEGECVDIDECLDEGSCEGTCENTVGSFRCLCDTGYEPGSEGECVDVDECGGGSPCHQHCLNIIGGYQCYCDNGYDLQSDRHTCQPSTDDEEYSTLTPDPSNSVHVAVFGHDIPWSSLFTPDPNFEIDTNFDADWVTEAPEGLPPDVAHGSENHLNQWDALSPKRHQTPPSPTQKGNTGNEINNGVEENAGSREFSPGMGDDTAGGSAPDMSETEGPNVDGTEETSGTAEAGTGSAEGKGKHDKSWLLVALLVPLCVFLVVMLALGIVYCTSCAVDKTLSFSDCYRWILPTTPPDRREVKTQA